MDTFKKMLFRFVAHQQLKQQSSTLPTDASYIGLPYEGAA